MATERHGSGTIPDQPAEHLARFISIFFRFPGFSGVAEAFTAWIVAPDLPALMIMTCILLAHAVLGLFMDTIGMRLLPLPVVYPAVVARGRDSIWFGLIVVKMAEICLATPPIGLIRLVVNAVRPDIPLSDEFPWHRDHLRGRRGYHHRPVDVPYDLSPVSSSSLR